MATPDGYVSNPATYTDKPYMPEQLRYHLLLQEFAITIHRNRER